MVTQPTGFAAHTPEPGSAELPALLAQAEGLLQQLQALEQSCRTYLEQLATVDWSRLAQQNKLAGIPKFRIERTIADARNVLHSGLRDLGGISREAQVLPVEPEALQALTQRVRAFIRLYRDTPTDIQQRHQRLTAWVAAIDQALEQGGEAPLRALLAPPAE